jgi:RNA polymerase sigma-70 factor (ECF subfamily)
MQAELEADGTASGATAGMAEAAGRLKRIVESLRDQDRQVIYLRFFLGLSIEETGEALSLPLGTVKSRLNRALERLREKVQQDHPDLRQALQE